MNYNKDIGESLKDYKIRLFSNKEVYGLTSQDIANLINAESGESKSESVYRKWWSAYKEGYADAESKKMDSDEILKEYEDKRIEAEKARARFIDQRTAYNKIIREEARADDIKSLITERLSHVEPYQPGVKFFPDDRYDADKDLFICLDDLHIGANINNYWNKYNSDIAKQRIDIYLSKIRDIITTHNISNCYVSNNGDSISGLIHYTIRATNRENIIEQIMTASELISYFLVKLADMSVGVYYTSVGGNHSRPTQDKKESLKGERLDYLIPWYLKARLSNVDNIRILDNCIDDTFSILNIRGKNYLNVHGDYDNFERIDKVIRMTGEDIYAVHMGHKHHNKTETIHGYKVFMSGSFAGMDDFCIEKRIYGYAQQLVCVVDSKGIVCSYDIDLQ